jgi:hypothetical protein
MVRVRLYALERACAMRVVIQGSRAPVLFPRHAHAGTYWYRRTRTARTDVAGAGARKSSTLRWVQQLNYQPPQIHLCDGQALATASTSELPGMHNWANILSESMYEREVATTWSRHPVKGHLHPT